MYGSALSYIGLREVYNVRQEWSNVTPVPLPNLPSGIWYKDSDTIQGIFAVVVILCFAEMFVGCWMAIIDRQQMIFGTPNQEGRVSMTFHGQIQFIYIKKYNLKYTILSLG